VYKYTTKRKLHQTGTSHQAKPEESEGMEDLQGLCAHQGRLLETIWKQKAHPEGHASYKKG
jgi:hypothetical protein